MALPLLLSCLFSSVVLGNAASNYVVPSQAIPQEVVPSVSVNQLSQVNKVSAGPQDAATVATPSVAVDNPKANKRLTEASSPPAVTYLATNVNPSKTDCRTDCAVALPELTVYQWQRVTITATSLVETVTIFVNPQYYPNTTGTGRDYAYPEDASEMLRHKYMTNEDGVVYTSVDTGPSRVVVVYPTPITVTPTSMTLIGGPAATAKPSLACTSAIPKSVNLTLLENGKLFTYGKVQRNLTQVDPLNTGNDTIHWRLLPVRFQHPNVKDFQKPFPPILALEQCGAFAQPNRTASITALSGIHYITTTVTSTITENKPPPTFGVKLTKKPASTLVGPVPPPVAATTASNARSAGPKGAGGMQSARPKGAGGVQSVHVEKPGTVFADPTGNDAAKGASPRSTPAPEPAPPSQPAFQQIPVPMPNIAQPGPERMESQPVQEDHDGGHDGGDNDESQDAGPNQIESVQQNISPDFGGGIGNFPSAESIEGFDDDGEEGFQNDVGSQEVPGEQVSEEQGAANFEDRGRTIGDLDVSNDGQGRLLPAGERFDDDGEWDDFEGEGGEGGSRMASGEDGGDPLHPERTDGKGGFVGSLAATNRTDADGNVSWIDSPAGSRRPKTVTNKDGTEEHVETEETEEDDDNPDLNHERAANSTATSTTELSDEELARDLEEDDDDGSDAVRPANASRSWNSTWEPSMSPAEFTGTAMASQLSWPGWSSLVLGLGLYVVFL